MRATVKGAFSPALVLLAALLGGAARADDLTFDLVCRGQFVSDGKPGLEEFRLSIDAHRSLWCYASDGCKTLTKIVNFDPDQILLTEARTEESSDYFHIERLNGRYTRRTVLFSKSQKKSEAQSHGFCARAEFSGVRDKAF